MDTIGYIRVSTFAQLSNYSLEVQKEAIRAFCKEHQLGDPVMVEDGAESGGTLSRPGIQQVIKTIQAEKVAFLVVHRLDRLTRDPVDGQLLLDLAREHGCKILSVTDGFDSGHPYAEAWMHNLASFAKYEREKGAERSKEGKRKGREKGKLMDRPRRGRKGAPGGRGGGRFDVASPEDEAIFKTIDILHNLFGETDAKIADALNAKGFTNKDGGPFTKKTVWDWRQDLRQRSKLEE